LYSSGKFQKRIYIPITILARLKNSKKQPKKKKEI
jgi:hypothetical protein